MKSFSLRISFLLPILRRAIAAGLVGGILTATGSAQDSMQGMPGMTGMTGMNPPAMGIFAGVPEARESSGTSWQPDTTPMHAVHEMDGDWMIMTHYSVFLSLDEQLGPRGAHQIDSANWAMFMATRQWSDDELMFRGMFTLEPWTVTDRGYPLLFQTGEAYQGQPLVDRQHPHDVFMELAARYQHALDQTSAVSLYLAPSGEPALGPSAFMHRTSAMDNPAAPISHHWMDSTHISFGVATLGVTSAQWQLEGSWFNGREPGQNRWIIGPPHLDSYSGRLSWNPAPEWSAQISYGYLASPEELYPLESEHRTTASVSHTDSLEGGRVRATTLAWGRNRQDGENSNALLLESDWQVSRLYTVFGRAEYVEKTGQELDLPAENEKFDISQITLGSCRELTPGRPFELAVGADVSLSFAPSSLAAVYGRRPLGYWIFIRLRPALMEHHRSGK